MEGTVEYHDGIRFVKTRCNVSEGVYRLITDNRDLGDEYKKGDEVRLISIDGDHFDEVGHHSTKGWVTITPHTTNPNSFFGLRGVKKDQLELIVAQKS